MHEDMNAMYWAQNRAYLFRTKTSIGSSLCHPLDGDCVVLVDGCEQPLLLRQVKEEEYRIVGNCFFLTKAALLGLDGEELTGKYKRPKDKRHFTLSIVIY